MKEEMQVEVKYVEATESDIQNYCEYMFNLFYLSGKFDNCLCEQTKQEIQNYKALLEANKKLGIY